MTEKGSPEIEVAARRQLVFGSTLLAVVLGTTVGLDRLSHAERVIDWLESQSLARAEKTRTVYSHDGGFTDFEDRLTLEEIPSIDTSRGGVYFIGSSDAKWGFVPRQLPAEERRLIHNLGIGATNHEMQGAFVSFLVDKRGFLSAGAEKTLFVFATSYHTVAHVHEENGFFPSLWRRHGVYTYSLEGGVGLVDEAPFFRSIRVERARIPGFLHALKRPLDRAFEGLGGERGPRRHDPAKYNEAWTRHMGPDWQEKLATQTGAFLKTALDLKARGARVSVVLLPQGSWEKNLPYETAYAGKMKEICAANGIPLVDLLRALDDEDLADSTHLNPLGQEKLLAKAREIARAHLQKTGALL